MRHRLVIGDVIDSHDFYLWMVDEQPEKVSSDSSESVDGDFCFQKVQGSGFRELCWLAPCTLYQLKDVFLRVVTRSHERAAFYVAEAHFFTNGFVFLELLGRDVFLHWQVFFTWL